MESDICAVILVGGKSSRMGKEKYALNYHGINQLNFLSQTIKSIFPEVYISCNKDQALTLVHYNNLIVDFEKFGNNGPFTAILSAFDELKSALFVIGCDYPFIDESDIKKLISNRDKNCNATCFENYTKQLPEPLIALYEYSCFDLLQNQFLKGDFSLRRFLLNNSVKIIFPTKALSIKSIDTTQEYESIKNEFSQKYFHE